MRRPAARWFLAALYALLLLGASSLPPNEVPSSWFPHQDKVMHLAAYTGFGWLLRRATGSTPLAILIGVVFGGVDELYQEFVSGRDGDVWDWLADAIGVSIGVSLYAWYEQRRRRQTPPGTG